MGSLAKPEFCDDIFPYIRVYKDGTFERLVGTDVVPAGFDPKTGVLSKDTIIVPETGLSVRMYRPNIVPKQHKLPLMLYFHGGAFCISSASDPSYHRALNRTVEHANVVAVSVDYRRAPEHPLPTAYDDCWDALKWVASHHVNGGDGAEEWLRDLVDFERVFLVGDSAGANIAHHVGIRVGGSGPSDPGLGIRGIGMLNPYFWGKEPIGAEGEDEGMKNMVDKWWIYVCPSGKGCDDPLINPFVEGAPSVGGLGCERVMVVVAEKDILRERGKVYYEKLVESGWEGSAEIMEVEGEDHVFHIFDPDCPKAITLFKRLASFINQNH